MLQAAVVAVLGCIVAVCCGCGVISSGQPVSIRGYRGTAIVSVNGRTVTSRPEPAYGPTQVHMALRAPFRALATSRLQLR
jgi:hypothetical protein